jgi:hypothetical protein
VANFYFCKNNLKKRNIMSRKPKWIISPLDKGVQNITLSSWKYFSDYVNKELLNYSTFIYRGHANSDWKLEPTIDRYFRSKNSNNRKEHLSNFKFAVRGRRGLNPTLITKENEWWALGQHYGLITPLLDWSESPFVALFFAIYNAHLVSSSSICVWALSQASVDFYNQEIIDNDSIKPIGSRKPTVEIIRPLSDENNRLVNQRGLFTRGPDNVNLEDWIREYDGDSNFCRLIKITIPKTEIDECLKYLNRMNINYATLFPDLFGASQHCNMAMKIEEY